jgi:hypothetical protein
MQITGLIAVGLGIAAAVEHFKALPVRALWKLSNSHP